MSKYFSKTTGCFYPADMQATYIAAGTWPADAVAVSDAVFSAMMARPTNKIIAADVNGLPVLTDPAGPTLAQAQAAQMAMVSAACQAAITAGIASSALGAPYAYPTKSTDQLNLTASVAASMIPGNPSNWATLLWCQSSAGTWEFTPHSAAQTQKAGQDVMAGILAMMAKNANLGAQIAAATSVPAVQAIVWS